uniref:Carboxylic ester hydrolase n=1 Tax=Periophthalmus magnuspinnatus TaxID=409849 RepID=A0A3B4A8A1_9GOBI
MTWTDDGDVIDLAGFLKSIYPGFLVRDEPLVGNQEVNLDVPEYSQTPDEEKVEFGGVSGPVVLTKDGQIRGLTLDKAHVFYGVPYAGPPTGAYRWKSPRPVNPWSGVYDATSPRAALPIKHKFKTFKLFIKFNTFLVSEDCLYLNVFVPLDVNLTVPLWTHLPVLVWIHGGDFIAGSASKPLYDGRFLSNFTHTVVVSMDYRLGAFGFLVSGKDPLTSAVGNYGILDQQAALLWVQRNIAVFGGDPGKVTIFGESAGAQSVSLHLMMQSSAPLFRQAVLQSLPFSIPLKTRSGPSHKAVYLWTLGQCFRSTALVQDRFNIILLLLFFLNVLQATRLLTKARLNPIVEVYSRFIPGRVLVSMMGYKLSVCSLRLPQIVTDYIFLCPARHSARSGVASGSHVWMYVFDHVTSDHRVWSGLSFCYQHVCHGAELPFVFNSAQVANVSMTPAERLLSNRMLCYWGAWAHTGDPSARAGQTGFCREQRLPLWPRYSDTSGWLLMNLTVRSHAQVGTREHICDFWDKLGIY